ncbi:MAG: 50S ribosomal protein L6 [Elusimicrobiota bacterium]
MSRVGKKPVDIPDKVEVKIEGKKITVESSGEKNTVDLPELISGKVEDGQIILVRENESKKARSLHGLFRTLVANAIQGLTEGFIKRLELVGRGKRAKVQKKNIVLELGFSHPVKFDIPENIEVKLDEEDKNIIIISGKDKQQVGQVAADIRDIQPPEPYKGAGIRYEDEYVRKKAGKTAIGGGFTGAGQ